MKKYKVMLITNIIAPYCIPLFNAIAKERDFDFKIDILAENEKNREWEVDKENITFNYKILDGYHLFIRNNKREIAIHANK